MRRLAVELRPSALDDFGLEPALRRLGETVREGGTLDVQVETRLGAVRLPADVETALYRIVQEALTNAVKHAGANHVSVVVTRKSTGVQVMIEDDGAGSIPRASHRRAGLLGMRERVELLDGTSRSTPRREPERRSSSSCRSPRAPRARDQPAASRASAASVRPKAGANLNPCPEQADATTIRPWRSRTNDSSAVLV